MAKYKVKAVGTRGLMVCNPLCENLQLKEPDMELAKQHAEKRLYKSADGIPILPTSHIKAAMKDAAKKVGVAGQGRTKCGKYIGSQIRVSAIESSGHTSGEIPIKGTWETDVRYCKVPSSGGRILVARPVFPEWSIEFEVEVLDDKLLPSSAIDTILTDAGRIYGIGTYREEFGQFSVQVKKIS
jgi:hypothetical protein